MRYYINADLNVRIESNCFLPGSVGFRLGAVLADDTTGIPENTCESLQRISEEVRDNLTQVLTSGLLQDH